jgi:hypothetical protein
MQNIDSISSAGTDPMWHLILHSKAFTVTATTSAITYLTAYSTDFGQAAQAVPQVINFIGTHGPIEGKSWADVMAFFSFLLVITNLFIGLQKVFSTFAGWCRNLRSWLKKPKRKGRR